MLGVPRENQRPVATDTLDELKKEMNIKDV